MPRIPAAMPLFGPLISRDNHPSLSLRRAMEVKNPLPRFFGMSPHFWLHPMDKHILTLLHLPGSAGGPLTAWTGSSCVLNSCYDRLCPWSEIENAPVRALFYDTIPRRSASSPGSVMIASPIVCAGLIYLDVCMLAGRKVILTRVSLNFAHPRTILPSGPPAR